jgi:hypothetical protein
MSGTATPRRNKKAKALPPPEPASVNEHVDEGEVRWIDKDQLTIPINEYQRDESQGSIAKDIALHFNKVAFGIITVIERSVNGGKPVLLVADGGTRLAAVRMRSDKDKVRCLVFRGMSKEQEADAFLAINQNRKRMNVEQLQHSEAFAGRSLAVHVDEVLNYFRDHRISFVALSALRSCVRKSPKPTDVVVYVLHHVAADKHLSVRVFKGLVQLEVQLQKVNRTLNEPSRIAKLQKTFGSLEGFVNAAMSASNNRTQDPQACARVIARTMGITYPKG